eukprot:999829-Prorocentrum_minimum.AAC.3
MRCFLASRNRHTAHPERPAGVTQSSRSIRRFLAVASPSCERYASLHYVLSCVAVPRPASESCGYLPGQVADERVLPQQPLGEVGGARLRVAPGGNVHARGHNVRLHVYAREYSRRPRRRRLRHLHAGVTRLGHAEQGPSERRVPLELRGL